MKKLRAATYATFVLLFSPGAGLAAGAVDEAAYKQGEQFKVTFVRSTDILQYHVNNQGKLIDLRRTSPPLRVGFDVRVSSVDSTGVVFEWRQRPGGEQMIGSRWKPRPPPLPEGGFSVETRLSLDANRITVTNLRQLVGQLRKLAEKKLSRVPAAQREPLRAAGMAQLKKLNEQTAVKAFASQSLLLSSAFLAKETRESRGGETQLSGATTGAPWTVKFTVSKDSEADGATYNWNREHEVKLAKAQATKNLPPQALALFAKFLKETATLRSMQSGSAIFVGGRPQQISLNQRTTSDLLGREQFSAAKLELKFDYTPQ